MEDGPINVYNTIKADKVGLVELSKMTKDMINDGPDRSAVTKEWVQDKLDDIGLALAAINKRIDDL